MGNQPDEVTRAALDAVSEAVELADREERQHAAVRGRGVRGRVRRLLARRPARAENAKGIRRLNATLAAAARRGAHVTGRGVSAGGRWLSARVLAMAPRLPVRDAATLRARAWAVLPFVPAAGVEITTETLAVVGIEIKLVAELHEVYGQAVQGGVVDRMTAYVGAWAQRRGVALAPGGVVLAAGSPLARQLQRRLAARAGRSILSLGPLLTGATAGGMINRRETRKLGRILSDDLRKRSPYANGWPD